MNTIFVFTKPNRMGVSKTRLAREVGYGEARRINAMSISRCLSAIKDRRWQAALTVAPDLALHARDPLWPRGMARLAQGGGDLGARMDRAFQIAPLGNVLFLGTDMPDITPALIASALKALKQNDAVFGPADDGGFWLYGQVKRINSRTPFLDVRWSTEHAMADVVAQLGNRKIGYLPTMIDLDDAEAVKAWSGR